MDMNQAYGVWGEGPDPDPVIPGPATGEPPTEPPVPEGPEVHPPARDPEADRVAGDEPVPASPDPRLMVEFF
jgi:hypothetical protein